MLGFIIPSFVGTIVLMTVRNTNTATKAGLLISYYIVLSFWAAQGLGMSMLSRNVAGSTKKSVAVAMNVRIAGPPPFSPGVPSFTWPTPADTLTVHRMVHW